MFHCVMCTLPSGWGGASMVGWPSLDAKRMKIAPSVPLPHFISSPLSLFLVPLPFSPQSQLVL